MLSTLSFLAFLTPLLQAGPALPEPSAPLSLVEVDGSLLPRLLALDLDLVEGFTRQGFAQVVAAPEDLARLRAARLPHRVVQADLAAFYRSRLSSGPDGAPAHGAWLNPPFASGAMGGYYTFAQVASVLDQMRAAYPGLISAKASLGTSVEGRPLYWVRMSDNPDQDEGEPEARVDALHHAREPEGMQASLWFMLWLLETYPSDPRAKYLLENRELYFVPVANPDGYVYNQSTNPGGGGLWRKNRRNNGGGSFGVDLNRNYPEKWGWDNTGSSPSPDSETYRGPSPASEPEVQGLTAFISARQFETALSVHTYSDLWLSPYGYAQLLPANNAQYGELSALATVLSQYVYGPIWQVLYLANGDTVDYDHNVHGTLCWTPEIGSSSDGFWPPTNRIVPLAEENLPGFQATALAAGAWVRELATARSEVGDGDGFFEPGEAVRWVVTARNSGRKPSGAATVSVSSTSPWVTVSTGQASLGSIGSFAQTSNAAAPLQISILAAAPGGTSVAYTVALAYEGWTQSFPGSFQVGEPRPVLIDDAELDLGWTKGLPGDTATAGKWVRGDPLGTTSGGQPCNPSDDATPPPGVQCFVTGNAGGSAGNDDVDNGFTTLLSPVFDLSHVGPATLTFARWFADLSTVDDVLQVSISNNGGLSWLSLENVSGNQNAWTAVEFSVPAFLPQTDQMRLRFVAADDPNNSLVEAAIDDLEVRTFDTSPRLLLYGTPALGGTQMLHVTGTPGASYVVVTTLVDPASAGGSGSPKIAIPTSRTVLYGVIGSGGYDRRTIALPSAPLFAGRTLWFRAGVGSGMSGQVTNWDEVTLP